MRWSHSRSFIPYTNQVVLARYEMYRSSLRLRQLTHLQYIHLFEHFTTLFISQRLAAMIWINAMGMWTNENAWQIYEGYLRMGSSVLSVRTPNAEHHPSSAVSRWSLRNFKRNERTAKHLCESPKMLNWLGDHNLLLLKGLLLSIKRALYFSLPIQCQTRSMMHQFKSTGSYHGRA